MTFFELMEAEYNTLAGQGKWPPKPTYNYHTGVVMSPIEYLAQQVADDILEEFDDIAEAQEYIDNMPADTVFYTAIGYEYDVEAVQIAINVREHTEEKCQRS